MSDAAPFFDTDSRGLLAADGTIDLAGSGVGTELPLEAAPTPSQPGDAWVADQHRRRTMPPTDFGVGPRLTVPAPPPTFAADEEEEPARSTIEAPADGSIHDQIADLYALGDYAGALCAAELQLGLDPNDEMARHYSDAAREGLEAHYSAKLGSLDRIYAVSVAANELKWLGLDPQALRVVPLLDGSASLRDVLLRAEMERLMVLKVFVELLDAGAITHVG